MSKILFVFTQMSLFLSFAAAEPLCGKLFYDQYLPGGIPIGILNKAGTVFIETPRLFLRIRGFQGSVSVTSRMTSENVGGIYYNHLDVGVLHLPLLGKSQFHGLGYATEYKYALIKYGFSKPDTKRIFAQILASNTASLKLHGKLGFKQSIPEKSGDILYFELTREDFHRLEASIDNPESFILPRTTLVREEKLFLQSHEVGTKIFIRRLHLALQFIFKPKPLTGGAADEIKALAQKIQTRANIQSLPKPVLDHFVRLFSYYEGAVRSNFSMHYSLTKYNDIRDTLFAYPEYAEMYRKLASTFADLIFEEAQQRGVLEASTKLRDPSN